jgi:hypothetical protein
VDAEDAGGIYEVEEVIEGFVGHLDALPLKAAMPRSAMPTLRC